MAGKKNQVRIIGGRWRGRKLEFPSVEGLRPTADRIRETLFNWLQPHLPQSHCLDLYAGSGALGFEAASRGAKSVLMVDNNIAVIRSLKSNKQTIQADNIQVMQRTAVDLLKQGLKKATESIEIAFLDPPFQKDELQRCVKQLEQSQCLSDNAIIYLECERELSLDFLPTNWVQHRSKTAGQVAYYLYHRESV